MKRPKAAYLTSTLASLVKGLNSSQKKQVLILVLVTDLNREVFQKTAEEVMQHFSSEVKDGLIRIVQAEKSFYPTLEKLPVLWNDKPERIKWRSKQCLDYAFLYAYAKNLGEYFLQIEDDVIVTENYFDLIKQFIKSNEGKEWSVLEFGARGFIGMLYRSSDLDHLSKFLKMYYWVFPVDILFRHYNEFQLYGNPEFARYEPPLFRHIGSVSSLKGQVRNLEDIPLGERIYNSSSNPPCNITTSITQHSGSVGIEGPYRTQQHGPFWGQAIKTGDFVLINFTKPVAVVKVVIETGIPSASEDTLGGGILETSTPDQGGVCNNFRIWQTYRDEPRLRAQSAGERGKVLKCLRLTIADLKKDKSGNAHWLAIREIAVWVSEDGNASTNNYAPRVQTGTS